MDVAKIMSVDERVDVLWGEVSRMEREQESKMADLQGRVGQLVQRLDLGLTEVLDSDLETRVMNLESKVRAFRQGIAVQKPVPEQPEDSLPRYEVLADGEEGRSGSSWVVSDPVCTTTIRWWNGAAWQNLTHSSAQWLAKLLNETFRRGVNYQGPRS